MPVALRVDKYEVEQDKNGNVWVYRRISKRKRELAFGGGDARQILTTFAIAINAPGMLRRDEPMFAFDAERKRQQRRERRAHLSSHRHIELED